MELSFVLLADPAGQMRARHMRNGHTYKANKQIAREKELRLLLLPHRPARPLTGPVILAVTAYFAPPQSKPPDRRANLPLRDWRVAASRGLIRHVDKPDLSNALKHLEDVMTSLGFWDDDDQVSDVIAAKRFGLPARWEVTVRPAPILIAPAEPSLFGLGLGVAS